MSTTTQDAEDLVREVVDALNDRAFDLFADTHAGDVVLHDHDETIRGVDGAIEHQQSLYRVFPDMNYAVEDVVVGDGEVAARWTVSGKQEGDFEGIPATGETIEIPAIGIFSVEDGEIAEAWLAYDRLGMLQQLGVVDSPGE